MAASGFNALHRTAAAAMGAFALMCATPAHAQSVIRDAEIENTIRVWSTPLFEAAGLVLVRQRPGSAKGVLFITLEDETGFANCIVWPAVFEQHRAIVGGDASEAAISAASILAKTDRDHEMLRLATLYPEYGIERHKGYPTPAHLAALRIHGPSPIHRRSFAPVAQCTLAF